MKSGASFCFNANHKTLLRHLGDGRFHSGEQLAKTMAVTRSAIWALAHDLRALGLEINALPRKGYRLAHRFDLLDADQVRAALQADALTLLSAIECHDALDSTNTYLAASARAGAATGTVATAEFQRAGRGRMGRSWLSSPGGSLCFSVLWHFADHAALSGLSLAVGVAIIRALRGLGVTDAGLKWPNDIIWRRRKLGGILLDVSGEVHGRQACVIGIGLNLQMAQAQGHEIDQPWADLAEITGGTQPDRNRLLAAALNELLPLLCGYGVSGLQGLRDEWQAYHHYHGETVQLYQGDRSISGRVAGISADGLLILDCGADGQRHFASGEVSLRMNGQHDG
ncbi:biotin--[acetyl-CoA-carboxylase] ligase [Candidatus Methylospira mobilis]|uniref:biotin--[acetyl-CoA-carboxylase] ligase n=1 Tax=Candidatus Methylospira mobilis TaxID=1808979 RepID=UPI0028EBFAFB|nr:biotin--[acetyl-CoA-carboxylase] ligase [Candidatus Methylospira mobilis]WNV05457.1 biotin--[acetyl-CoA-carboxylase] ligase [Candidatus Methylospira mobilis]